MKTLDHPPCSPDLAPCDFGLFPKLKAQIRGQTFATVEDLQNKCHSILRKMPKSVFDDAIHNMVIRCQKCSAVNGEYFEGDKVTVDPLFWVRSRHL